MIKALKSFLLFAVILLAGQSALASSYESFVEYQNTSQDTSSNKFVCFSAGDTIKGDSSETCTGESTGVNGFDNPNRIAKLAVEDCYNQGCTVCRIAQCF